MILGRYLVCGVRDYRGHKPGTTFDARLIPGAEQRAVGRGDIRLLGRVTPAIQPGSLTLPDGWLTNQGGK